MVAETRRRAHAKATFELNKVNGSIFKLPPELVRMIFETFVGGEHRSWLARISTLCKALMPDVEAALYRQTAVFSWNTTLLCHALIKRPYLALAVRSLIVLCTDGCAGIKQPLKSAFQLLTSLIRLELIVDDPSIFASLLGAPFRLRILLAGGHHYPACFEAILASQPSLELLVLFFTTGLMEHPRGRSACMLFDAIPVLWCLRIYGYEEFAGTDTIAEVFTRAEDKTCKGPETISINLQSDDDEWLV